MRAVGDHLPRGHGHLLPHLGIWVQTSPLRGDLESRNIKQRNVLHTILAQTLVQLEKCIYLCLFQLQKLALCVSQTFISLNSKHFMLATVKLQLPSNYFYKYDNVYHLLSGKRQQVSSLHLL